MSSFLPVSYTAAGRGEAPRCCLSCSLQRADELQKRPLVGIFFSGWDSESDAEREVGRDSADGGGDARMLASCLQLHASLPNNDLIFV